jgi:pimeloyl-ACP methyl ester carboxylesterase
MKTMCAVTLEIITEKPGSNAHSTPLLFVHGMYHGAWCWAEHFLPYFAQQGYVSHAVSLRGHGASEGHEKLKWTSIDDYVEDITRVVDQLERPPVLVGHSMGGIVVQKYLESHDVPAAVLLASGPPGGIHLGIVRVLRVIRKYPIATLKARLTMSLLPIVNDSDRLKTLFFSEDIPDEKLKKYFALIQDESLRAAMSIIYGKIRPELIKTPILVLGAANDFLVTSKDLRVTEKAYNTKAELFPDMAHDMMLETGWQTVADRILQWLKQQGI